MGHRVRHQQSARFHAVVLLLALLAASLVAGAAATPDAHAATLKSRLGAAVRHSGVAGISSVVVYNSDSRKVIYMYNGREKVAPASNQKLVTAAGVLHGLGPNQRLKTQVAIRGTIVGGELRGNVYLVGGGDPTLSTPSFRRRWYGGKGGRLEVLARALRKQGIRRIKGRIIVDDGFFDRQRYVGVWPARYRYDESPALGALIVNRNTGAGPRIAKPDVQAGRVFRQLVQGQGIRIRGGQTRGRTPMEATVLATTWSPPMKTLVAYMNTYSDNFTAEMLLKALGRLRGGTGSTRRGGAVAKQRLRMMDVNTTGMRVADGSGLSRGNRISAAQLAELLNAVDQDATIRATFRRSLAISGRTGTIRRRMTTRPYRGRVRAKTGTLYSVSALSGYASRVSGGRYGFVVIQDRGRGYVPLGSSRRLQDTIARILVR